MKGQKEKRPLAQVRALAESLKETLADSCERIEIAGSIRREKPEVGDIELVAIPKMVAVTDLFGEVEGAQSNQLWAKLDELAKDAAEGIHYTKTGEKYRQFLCLLSGSDVQVDVFTCAAGNWGWVYLVRTGSADFSHHMASRLNQNGYTSREAWVTRLSSGKRVKTETEEAVFKLANEQYRAPKDRSW